MTEIKLLEAEINKVKLEPGEVLVVKVKSDEITQSDMNSLSEGLKAIFVNNKVVVLCCSPKDEISLTAVKQADYPVNDGNQPQKED